MASSSRTKIDPPYLEPRTAFDPFTWNDGIAFNSTLPWSNLGLHDNLDFCSFGTQCNWNLTTSKGVIVVKCRDTEYNVKHDAKCDAKCVCDLIT